MSEFELNFNPFPSPSREMIDEQLREGLFNLLKEGDGDALDQFAKCHSEYIEKLILMHQGESMLSQTSFAALYDEAIGALKQHALSSGSLHHFDRFFLWVIRQSMLRNTT